MANPQNSHTNAADTAPGVDDGKVRAQTSVNSKPGGRGLAWLIVGLSLVILAVVFLARPGESSNEARQQAAIDGRAADASPELTATPEAR